MLCPGDRNTTCLRHIASGLGGWSAVLALGCRQVEIFLPLLLKTAKAREVGPLLRSPQHQAHAGLLFAFVSSHQGVHLWTDPQPKA